MLIYFEERRRWGKGLGDLYTVKTWALFGFIVVYRRWEQLTTRNPLPSEAG